MPGPAWEDEPADSSRLEGNARSLAAALKAAAAARAVPQLAMVLDWHRSLYDGCEVPCAGYLGTLRGDPAVPELVGYEVGIGPTLADGLPEKVGVYSATVGAEVETLIAAIARAVQVLDARFRVGQRPSTVDELHELVALAAVVHGEWIRLHPFANGNGRTARVWVVWLMLRYGMPPFLTLKPRPSDAAYARAGRASMGRPPDFTGDHGPATMVFTHLLALALLP